MKYDLSQPISQRGIGEKDAENQRIAEIADELRRRCQVYEAESGAGQEHVGRYDAEQRSAESYAKEKGMWIPMDEVLSLICLKRLYFTILYFQIHFIIL